MMTTIVRHDGGEVTEKLLTPETFAAPLAVKPSTVRKWAREGKVKSIKLAWNAVRFEPAELERVRREGLL